MLRVMICGQSNGQLTLSRAKPQQRREANLTDASAAPWKASTRCPGLELLDLQLGRVRLLKMLADPRALGIQGQ
jgi:hypothetical protein